MNHIRDPRILPSAKIELQRAVTAPILASSIREYFVNKDIVFMIDYTKSDLKGIKLLTYLSNLNMPTDVVMDPSNYEEYAELMTAYFQQRAIVNCNAITGMATELILNFAQVPRHKHPYSSNISDEYLDTFCHQYEEILALWRIFLDSMLVFVGMKVMELQLNDNEEMLIVDDKEVIGHNVANIIGAPNFLTTYFELTSLETKAYFKKQFEEPMFGGKDLMYYFYSPDNTLPKLLNKDMFTAASSNEAKIFVDFVHHLQTK